MNLTVILLAKVDSALSGKNAALSFSCTVESFPNVGPATDEIPSQAIIAMIAIQSGLRPFTELLFLICLAMGYKSLSSCCGIGVKSIRHAILITPHGRWLV